MTSGPKLHTAGPARDVPRQQRADAGRLSQVPPGGCRRPQGPAGSAASARPQPQRLQRGGHGRGARTGAGGTGAPRSPGDTAQHHGTGHGAAAGQEPPPHGGRGGGRGRPLQQPARKAPVRREAERSRFPFRSRFRFRSPPPPGRTCTARGQQEPGAATRRTQHPE